MCVQPRFCMKSKPQLALEWMPSHDWMKAHPWLTNDILSFQSAGGGSQACQLPATAETPLVNLPLAGLNKIWNVKSLHTVVFHFLVCPGHLDISAMWWLWISICHGCQGTAFISEIQFGRPLGVLLQFHAGYQRTSKNDRQLTPEH